MATEAEMVEIAPEFFDEDTLTAEVPGVVVEVAPVDEKVKPLVMIEQAAVENVNLTSQQKALIQQVNSDATAAELEVFFYQCARTGLDPIANQIYLVRRNNRMVIQTGIDGYRLVAARSGLMAGSDDPIFANDGDDWPISATVTVYRIAADGERYGYTATARWSEYAPADIQDSGAFMWRKMSHTMLGKCAEALALRKAFPNELSGVYTDVEMDQAGPADSTPRAPVSERHFCPECEKAGKQVPVVDNRERHLNPAEGKKAPPAWKCANNERCSKSGKWGWGSWDLDYFDNLETSDADELTMGRPSMAGIFQIADTPKDAVRKWLAVEFRQKGDEAKLFWAAVLEARPDTERQMDLLTEAQALEIEETMIGLLDEWTEPFV